MATTKVTIKRPASPILWRAVRDQLREELAGYAWGDWFYSINDVCQKFSVSKITAIRVIDELAAEGLIEKIPFKGNRVCQVPEASAVSLRLIIPANARPDYFTFDPIVRWIYQGIVRFVQDHHIDFDTLTDLHLKRFSPKPSDRYGLLLFRSHRPETLRFLHEHNLPYVLVDPFGHYRHLPHVRVDRVQAGYLAARHLLDLGHRRIGWIFGAGAVGKPNFRDRLRGYRDALSEAGLAFDDALISQMPPRNEPRHEVRTLAELFRPDDIAPALTRLLALRPAPTAIMVGSDHQAMQLLEICRGLGIRVPGDLSIMGYPNYPEARLADPPLSVVDPRFEQVGRAAARFLLEQMFQQVDPATQAMRIEPQLLIRASTGPAPAMGNTQCQE